MAHGDAREEKWRGNWEMEWVTNTLHTILEHDVSSITTADTHTSAASSRLNWMPCRFKWTRPFRQRRNLVSARVPSHFKRSLLLRYYGEISCIGLIWHRLLVLLLWTRQYNWKSQMCWHVYGHMSNKLHGVTGQRTISFFFCFFAVALRPNAGHGLLILEVSRSHTTTHHSQ